MDSPIADLSRTRRRHVLQLLRRSGILTNTGLTDRARLVYTVGCLVCDDAGRIKQPVLTAALNDPSIVQVARTLLRKAGH